MLTARMILTMALAGAAIMRAIAGGAGDGKVACGLFPPCRAIGITGQGADIFPLFQQTQPALRRYGNGHGDGQSGNEGEGVQWVMCHGIVLSIS